MRVRADVGDAATCRPSEPYIDTTPDPFRERGHIRTQLFPQGCLRCTSMPPLRHTPAIPGCCEHSAPPCGIPAALFQPHRTTPGRPHPWPRLPHGATGPASLQHVQGPGSAAARPLPQCISTSHSPYRAFPTLLHYIEQAGIFIKIAHLRKTISLTSRRITAFTTHTHGNQIQPDISP